MTRNTVKVKMYHILLVEMGIKRQFKWFQKIQTTPIILTFRDHLGGYILRKQNLHLG